MAHSFIYRNTRTDRKLYLGMDNAEACKDSRFPVKYLDTRIVSFSCLLVDSVLAISYTEKVVADVTGLAILI